LNTPREIDDSVDRAIWIWGTQNFGGNAPNEDPDGDSIQFVLGLRFSGQYYDSESGLSYNYSRDYEADTGRYIESDLIGLDGGANTYTYAAQNPLSRFDMKGESSGSATCGAGCHTPPAIPVPFPRPAIPTPAPKLPGVVIWGAMFPGAALLTRVVVECMTGSGGGDDRCDRKLSTEELRKLHIDAHAAKEEALGTDKGNSRFDLCACKDGRIVVKRLGCQGNEEPQPTPFTWK